MIIQSRILLYSRNFLYDFFLLVSSDAVTLQKWWWWWWQWWWSTPTNFCV